jgi:hypothetical protein
MRRLLKGWPSFAMGQALEALAAVIESVGELTPIVENSCC